MAPEYPQWAYFPRSESAPDWATSFLQVVHEGRKDIDSLQHPKFDSNEVLSALRDQLVLLGWEVESGKSKAQKINRPVLFGDQGAPRVEYDIDGWHPDHGAVLEIESGRGWQGNAVYRDLIRTPLIQGADYLVLGLRSSYTYNSSGKVISQNDFDRGREQIDAIYASGRLHLPFKGLLLFGW